MRDSQQQSTQSRDPIGTSTTFVTENTALTTPSVRQRTCHKRLSYRITLWFLEVFRDIFNSLSLLKLFKFYFNCNIITQLRLSFSTQQNPRRSNPKTSDHTKTIFLAKTLRPRLSWDMVTPVLNLLKLLFNSQNTLHDEIILFTFRFNKRL